MRINCKITTDPTGGTYEVIIPSLTQYPTRQYYFTTYRSYLEEEPTNILTLWKNNSGATSWSEMAESRMIFYDGENRLKMEGYIKYNSTNKTYYFYLGYEKNGIFSNIGTLAGTTDWEDQNLPVFNIILGEKYKEAGTFSDLMTLMKSIETTKYNSEIFNEPMDDFVHSPLIFTNAPYNDERLLTINDRSTYYVGLNHYANWYTMFKGLYLYGEPFKLKLASPINGIEEIELSVPCVPTGNFEKISQNEYTLSYNESEETVKVTASLFLNLGTDLEALFSEENDTLYLENFVIKRSWNTGYYNAQPTYTMTSSGESFSQSTFYGGNYRDKKVNSCHIVLNPTYALIKPDSWIGHIPDEPQQMNFESFPFSFINDSYFYNEEFVKLQYFESEQPSDLRVYLLNYKNNINPDTYYRIYDLCYNEAVISRTFWEGILEGNFPKKKYDYGEGSIGGGISGSGGNDGLFDDTNGSFSGDVFPTSGNITGIVSSFLIDETTAADFAATLNALESLLDKTNYFEFIMTFHQIFVPTGNIQVAGEKRSIHIAGRDSLLQGTEIKWQYNRHACGTYNFERYYGNFLDFPPYTKYELYLPFADSMIELDPTPFYGGELIVYANIDLLTGSILWEIVCKNNGGKNTITTVPGNCSQAVPLTASSYNERYRQTISGVLGIGASLTNLLVNPASNPIADFSNIAKTALNAGSAVNKRNFGNLNSLNGVNMPKVPYIIETRQKMHLPENYGHEKGFPSMITSQIKNLEGYTKMSNIHLENMKCTDDEVSMIENLLTGGFIV